MTLRHKEKKRRNCQSFVRPKSVAQCTSATLLAQISIHACTVADDIATGLFCVCEARGLAPRAVLR